MLITPAIDIMNGKCVRLTQGDYSRITKYPVDPQKVLKQFRDDGACLVHIVDLDGARTGKPINSKAIIRLAQSAKIPIEVGGGIRAMQSAENYLTAGIYRVVLGTIAIENPKFLKRLLAKFGPNRIGVSLDIKNGLVATRGWIKSSNLTLKQALLNLKNLGIKNVTVTDISKDGRLRGPNLKMAKIAASFGLNITLAGGVTTIGDIATLRKAGVSAAIIGKAIYENKIDLAKTLKQFSPATPLTKRIIPCLDIKDGRVVKGVGFKNLRDVGDPIKLAKRYNQEGADELVFLDIDATNEKRKNRRKLAAAVAKELNIPFTIGGGISTLRDIKDMLDAGADKVAINSAAVTNPKLVAAASKRFGNQCIAVSIDAKRWKNSWQMYIRGGRKATGTDAVKFAKKMARLGAGELLVNSLDRDGTATGYDLALLKKIIEVVNIPVIASSGAGCKEDFLSALKNTNVDAVLAASLFHSVKLNINILKKYLKNNKINVRI